MLFDHELKINRAMKHVEDLRVETRRWVSGDHHTLRCEVDRDAVWREMAPLDVPTVGFDPHHIGIPIYLQGSDSKPSVPEQLEYGRGVITAYATAEQPPRDPIGLLIGETLHNL